MKSGEKQIQFSRVYSEGGRSKAKKTPCVLDEKACAVADKRTKVHNFSLESFKSLVQNIIKNTQAV